MLKMYGVWVYADPAVPKFMVNPNSIRDNEHHLIKININKNKLNGLSIV